MDLVAGVRRVVVIMEHRTREGGPKILERCSLPLTGARCVHRIITELGVIDVTPAGPHAGRDCRTGVTREEIQAATEPRLL